MTPASEISGSRSTSPGTPRKSRPNQAASRTKATRVVFESVTLVGLFQTLNLDEEHRCFTSLVRGL